MNDITVKGSRPAAQLVSAIIFGLVAIFYGWKWAQGDNSGSTKFLTVAAAAFVGLKVFLLLKPAYLRLSGETFLLRMGAGLQLSTPADNVSSLDLADGSVRIRFQELSKVQAPQHQMTLMEQGFPRRGCHFTFPLGSDRETFENFRKATLKDRAESHD
jgi:hypothetical protein